MPRRFLPLILNHEQFERPYTMVALVHPDEYAMNEGLVAASSGEAIAVGHNSTVDAPARGE